MYCKELANNETGDITLDFEGNEDEHLFELEFTVPEKADDDLYDIEIILEGEDEENNDYNIKWLIKLEVNRLSHELIIRNFEINPSVLSNTPCVLL